MPQSLHTDKIRDEKNAFIEELYNTIPSKADLLSGENASQAVRLHKLYLTFYIMANFKNVTLQSPYFNNLMSCIIESESLFFLGFKNSGMTLLRSAIESAFKLLYYEYHPIELIRNTNGDFDLRGLEYREFLYSFPAFSAQNVIKKDDVERVWSKLCEYTHSNVKTVDQISLVAEIKPIFETEQTFTQYLSQIKQVLRTIICILFLVSPNWLEHTEKSYFDYVFEILFDATETSALKVNFRIV